MKKTVFLLLFTFIIGCSFVSIITKEHISTTAQAQTTSIDWPQLQHDAQHTGYTPDTYGPPYTQLWRRDQTSTPPAPPISVRVQPVIAYSRVYLPSDDKSLYAFNTSNGSLSWKYATTGALVASAGVDTVNGIVFTGSTDGIFYAVDALTGNLKWKYQTSNNIRVSPVIANNTVYIANNDGNIYAFDPVSGNVKWQKSVTYPILETPAFYNSTLYIGNFGSQAIALDGTTGATLWQKQLQGQGFRDRWVVAGNGKVMFTTVPYPGANVLQTDGTNLLTPIYTATWATQRQAIIDHLTQQPFYKAVYELDAITGNETITPILYTSGGSTSEHSQPVVLPNGNFNVLYRYTEGIPNPGCGATCIIWSQYLGELNPIANDITRLDTWGTGTSADITKKIIGHTDESSGLSRTGNIIYIDASRGTIGFDTVAKTVIPFTAYDPGIGAPISNAPINLYPGITNWVPKYPGEEADSDGNDYKRPTPIANGVFYVLHNSVLVAVQATKK